MNERASSQMVRTPVQAIKRSSQFVDAATVSTLAAAQEEIKEAPVVVPPKQMEEETKGPARSAPV